MGKVGEGRKACMHPAIGRVRDGASPGGASTSSPPAASPAASSAASALPGDAPVAAPADSLSLSPAARLTPHDLPDAPSALVQALDGLSSDEQARMLGETAPATDLGPNAKLELVGYAVDDAQWNRMGRPQGYMPISYLRTRIEADQLGFDLEIRDDGAARKPHVGVSNVTWEGRRVEDIARDKAEQTLLDFYRQHPGYAIPIYAVGGAAAAAGFLAYAHAKGPIRFDVGSIKLYHSDALSIAISPKARIGGKHQAYLGADGGSVKLDYHPEGMVGNAHAEVSYDTRDRFRIQGDYGVSFAHGAGHFGVGAWVTPDSRVTHRADYGAGAFLNLTF